MKGLVRLQVSWALAIAIVLVAIGTIFCIAQEPAVRARPTGTIKDAKPKRIEVTPQKPEGKSKSDYRREHPKPSSLQFDEEDPITPVLVHSIERYLNGATDLSPADIAARNAIQKHPYLDNTKLQKFVSAWKSIPEESRNRITPAELRNLNVATKLDMTVYRTVVQRAIQREKLAPLVCPDLTASPTLMMMAAPMTLKVTDAVDKTATTAGARRRIGAQAAEGIYISKVGLVPMVVPKPPSITSIQPVDPDYRPYQNPGRVLTINGENFPWTPDWPLTGSVVHFYKPGTTTEVGGTTPFSANGTKLDVITPTIPEGKYDVEVEVFYHSGPLKSNRKDMYVGKAVNNIAPVLTTITPASPFPGSKITLTGDKFTQNPPVVALIFPIDISFPVPSAQPTFINQNTLEITLPVDTRPGKYRVALTSGGSPLSAWRDFTVRAPKYKIEFTQIKCEDESDPEWYGDDEVASYWAISSDGLVWTKNTGEYSGFEDGTTKNYSTSDRCVFVIDGTTREVSQYLVVGTRLMEIDATDAKAASEVLGMVGDFVGNVGDFLPGIGSTICTIIKYVLKAVAWIVEEFGGGPDDLGYRELSWTYADLQKNTNNTSKSFTGNLYYGNNDDTGSYRIWYQVMRYESP